MKQESTQQKTADPAQETRKEDAQRPPDPCAQATPLADCDDRLVPSQVPNCQNYFQLVRLLGFKDFEQKIPPKVTIDTSAPIVAAPADIQYLLKLLQCAAQKVVTKLPDPSDLQETLQKLIAPKWATMQAPTNCSVPPIAQDVELALVLRYQQCWHPKGYLRGELLNSISLAPGEELKLEIFDWDRRRTERELAASTSRDLTSTGSVTSRISAEIATSLDFRLGAGASQKSGMGLSLAAIDLPISISADAGYNFENELKTSVASTGNMMQEATRTATNTLHAERKTRIVEVAEIGSETRSIRTLRNENRCHTMNYDYFEILECWHVTIDLADAELVAKVPLPDIGPVDAAWLLCHEWPLRNYLLDAVYEAGFEAARLVEAERYFRDIAVAPFADFTASDDDPDPSAPPPDKLGDELRVFVTRIYNAKQALAQLHLEVEDLADVFSLNESIRNSAYKKISRIATRDLITMLYPVLFDNIDELWANRDAPGHLLFQHFEIFFAQYNVGSLTNLLGMIPAFSALPLLLLQYNDAGLIGAIQAAANRVKQLRQALQTDSTAHVVLPGTDIPDDVSNNQDAAPSLHDLVEAQFGLRNLAEAMTELQRLICHVNDNLDYYLTKLYLEKGVPAWDEILAASPHARDIVELRVLAIQDGYALFPVRKYSPHHALNESIKEIVADIKASMTHNVTKVTVPSRGTVLEARLGNCNACEPFIQEHRKLDLDLKALEVKIAGEETRQQRAESLRQEARLSQDPPLLDAEHPRTWPLEVQLRETEDGDDI